MKTITFDRFARVLFTIALIVGLFFLLDLLSAVLLPFCVACLLAYMLYPMMHFFERKLHIPKRVLSILLTLILLVLLFWGIYEIVIPPMFDELDKAQTLLATYLSGNTHTVSLPEAIHNFIIKNISAVQLKGLFSQENITNAAKTILPRFFTMLGQSIDLIFQVVSLGMILLYTFFILLDYEALSGGWVNLLPTHYQQPIQQIVNDVATSMNRYFRGQALVALLGAIFSTTGFLIIGLPMAIAMGMLVGILTLIPYMKVFALIPTLFLTFLKCAYTGDNLWIPLLSVLAVFATVELIENFILVPNIMGRITGLNPAIILLSLSIWGTLLGIIGMIIALPITTLLVSYYRRYRISEDQKTDYYSKRNPLFDFIDIETPKETKEEHSEGKNEEKAAEK